jgi:hypothetical protein
MLNCSPCHRTRCYGLSHMAVARCGRFGAPSRNRQGRGKQRFIVLLGEVRDSSSCGSLDKQRDLAKRLDGRVSQSTLQGLVFQMPRAYSPIVLDNAVYSFARAGKNVENISSQALQLGDLVEIGQLRQSLGTPMKVMGDCRDSLSLNSVRCNPNGLSTCSTQRDRKDSIRIHRTCFNSDVGGGGSRIIIGVDVRCVIFARF